MKSGQPSYFKWQRYESARPQELDGPGPAFQVAVVGAGPVGLASALTLAQQGIRVVLLETRDQLSANSRTIAVSRRSAQVLDRLGLAGPFKDVSAVRQFNQVYHGSRLVHTASYERVAAEKWPDTSSLQQPWTEKILLDGVLNHPNIDLRWLNEVRGVDLSDPQRPKLAVHSPHGDYSLTADYVIAADGARSSVKRCLGCEYEEIGAGTSGRRFVICDFEMKTSSPYTRRLMLHPPYKPGSVALLHRQPFNVWRLDYAIDSDEDIEEQTREDVVAARVRAQIDMLDDPTADKDDVKIVWISGYTPRALSLPDYRHGRVFFAGDAAHQTPIFGGRGMNQGLLDQANLCWRLGFVINGHASPSILDRYDLERRPIIIRNLRAVEQATLFMSNPTRGSAVMREAVLGLLPTEPFVLGLIDAFAAARAESNLTPAPDVDPPIGAAEGSPLPDAQIKGLPDGKATFVHELLRSGGFTGIYFTEDGSVPGPLVEAFKSLHSGNAPFRSVVVGRVPEGACTAWDETGTAFERLAVRHGSLLLVRPDGYVCARLERAEPLALLAAFRAVLGFS
ncbi:MAG: FAD-dependent oxidoreductase [Pseudomonadota bacterium]